MTEDDTFRALTRAPFSEVLKACRENQSRSMDETIRKLGWTPQEAEDYFRRKLAGK